MSWHIIKRVSPHRTTDRSCTRRDFFCDCSICGDLSEWYKTDTVIDFLLEWRRLRRPFSLPSSVLSTILSNHGARKEVGDPLLSLDSFMRVNPTNLEDKGVQYNVVVAVVLVVDDEECNKI